MRLEFLQSEDDVYDFVEFLYSKKVVLSRRNLQLTHQDAFNSISLDLHLAGGVYSIWLDNHRLLTMNSCSRDSHPRKLGNPGRIAGLVSQIDDSPKAKELMTVIKQYFKKKYIRKKYNGQARMVCFFGPSYTLLDDLYQKSPEDDNIWPGLIQIICAPGQEEVTEKNTVAVLNRVKGISNLKMTWRVFWEDNNFRELRIDFLHNTDLMTFDICKKLVVDFSDKDSQIDISNSYLENLYMGASNNCTLSDISHNKARRKVFVYFSKSWVSFKRNTS